MYIAAVETDMSEQDSNTQNTQTVNGYTETSHVLHQQVISIVIGVQADILYLQSIHHGLCKMSTDRGGIIDE